MPKTTTRPKKSKKTNQSTKSTKTTQKKSPQKSAAPAVKKTPNSSASKTKKASPLASLRRVDQRRSGLSIIAIGLLVLLIGVIVWLIITLNQKKTEPTPVYNVTQEAPSNIYDGQLITALNGTISEINNVVSTYVNRDPQTTNQITATTYRGLIPCADCPGIDDKIVFYHANDNQGFGTYTETLVYQDRDGEPVVTTGKWALINDLANNQGTAVYFLMPDTGTGTSYWRINQTSISLLDNSTLQPVSSGVPYQLYLIPNDDQTTQDVATAQTSQTAVAGTSDQLDLNQTIGAVRDVANLGTQIVDAIKQFQNK